MFPIFFQILMGIEKLRCDVPMVPPNHTFTPKLFVFLLTYLPSIYLLIYLLMKNIKAQMLLYTLINFFIKVQRNMLNAFGIILFDKMV